MSLQKKIKYYYTKRKRISALDLDSTPFPALTPLTPEQFHFSDNPNPVVSILIPMNNGDVEVEKCLTSIHNNLPDARIEIIVININADTKRLSKIENISIVSSDAGITGSIKAINKAIAQARGSFIHILNNVSEVKKGFQDELLYVFEHFESIGVAGSRILNVDGSLQEAGAFFIKDSKIAGFSAAAKWYYPEINFISRADYFSESLLFRKYNNDGVVSLLNEQYTSLHWAAADLCFRLKYNEDKEIYYTPFSEVISGRKNNESITLKNDLERFRERWNSQLSIVKSTTIYQRKVELYNNKCVAFINVDPLAPDKDSGSNRMKELMIGYQKLGYYIVQIASRNKITNPYNQLFQRIGVCVYYEHLPIWSNDRWKFFKRLALNNVLVWLAGPQVFIRNYKKLNRLKDISKKLLFDMGDIHHLRLQRALEREPDNAFFKKEYITFLKWENEAFRAADVVTAISRKEAIYVKNFAKIENVVVVTNIHKIKDNIDAITFESRKGLLFIGSTHTPNIDAVQYLYNEIMPIVWNKKPEIIVNIVGNVNEKVQNINDDKFLFKGHVPDITTLFNSSRAMVAPLRYGAGVKGKIGQAFEFKLPVITSDIGVEGMNLENGKNVLVANDAETFAARILDLYSNESLWQYLREEMEVVLEQYSEEVMLNSLKEIESMFAPKQ